MTVGRRVVTVAVAALVTVGAAACEPAPAPGTSAASASHDPRAAADRLLSLLNEERRVAGLAPLARHSGADWIAQDAANRMAAQGRLSHTGNLGGLVTERITGSWRAVGENVGVNTSADAMHAAFMGSRTHRANILNGAFSTVGVAVTVADGQLWAAVVFVG